MTALIKANQLWNKRKFLNFFKDEVADDEGLGFVTPESHDDQIDDFVQGETDNAQGYFQIEVTYPHHKLSNIASYNMDCEPSAGAGVAELVSP